jgi:hypothetical protein
MKKSLLVLSMVAFVFASCKKDRTCECSYSDGTKESTPIPNSTKKDAEEACDALGALNLAFGGGTCELK